MFGLITPDQLVLTFCCCCCYCCSDNYFLLSQRHPEVPRLTADQYEAMKLFNELAASDEMRLDYMLQPGEIQLLNNHTALHARSEFVDCEDVDKRRHLLR